MKRLLSLLLVVSSLFASGGCGGSEPDIQVLFIGNSYSQRNDLPGLVAEIGRANGTEIGFKIVAQGGWRLSQHVQDSNVHGLIRSGDFDIVVIQEQSQLPAIEDRLWNETLPSTQTLVRMVEASGSEALLFQTWGHQNGSVNSNHSTYEGMQAALVWGYDILAADTGAAIAPVGVTWSRAMRFLPSVMLYDIDGSHPSPAGSYLAALVITNSILGQAITEAPDALIDQETADALLRLMNG